MIMNDNILYVAPFKLPKALYIEAILHLPQNIILMVVK